MKTQEKIEIIDILIKHVNHRKNHRLPVSLCSKYFRLERLKAGNGLTDVNIAMDTILSFPELFYGITRNIKKYNKCHVENQTQMNIFLSPFFGWSSDDYKNRLRFLKRIKKNLKNNQL